MRRSAVILLLGVLVVASCGSRLSDEQRAALVSTGGDPVTGDVIARSTTTTTIAGDGSSTATAPTEAGGGGGDVGGGDGGEAGQQATDAVGGGSSCGGGGDSEVGVTETEIRIGNVSTISGAVDGFGQTGVNGVKAYVNFVNATGGVCGRELTLLTADDALQSGRNKSETDKLKDQVIGFVGGTTVVDDGSAQSLEGTNIADTSIAINDAKIRSPNNFPTNPIDLADGGNGAVGILKHLKAARGVTKAALVLPEQASARARGAGYVKDLERAGIPVVLEALVSPTETNYADDAASIEAAGADIVLTTLEVTGMTNLAKAFSQNGYFPKVPFYGAQAYGRNFLTLAGGAADPTVLGLAYNIIEDAGSIPAVSDLKSWYDRTNPGADLDFFSIYGWVAADLYVSALRSVDGPPTRDKVLANLQATTDYDANGLIAPVNPAQKKGAKCFIIVEVQGGKWTRTHPGTAGQFDCSQA